MKLFVSQPMSGLTNEEIENNRVESMNALSKLYKDIEYDPTNIYVVEDPEMEEQLTVKGDMELSKNRISIFYFLRSIQHMAGKDAIVFLNGWQYSRGCILEYFIAKAFKMRILGEFTIDGFKDFISFNVQTKILMNLFNYFK